MLISVYYALLCVLQYGYLYVFERTLNFCGSNPIGNEAISSICGG